MKIAWNQLLRSTVDGPGSSDDLIGEKTLHLRIPVQSIAWRETPDEESGDDMSILILIADSNNENSEMEFSVGSDDKDD
ncbi:hypothetical protein ACHWQZ_G011613 [Mnemiopsis leidyi]